ncbi:MAG: MMPL family transporter, partial [Gammaproteobacteria bacterium]
MGITEKLSELVSRYTWLTIILYTLLTLLALTAIVNPLTGQLRLNIDPSANRLISDDLPAKIFYEQTRRIFGSDETLIITLAAADVFTPEVFDTVTRMTQRISEIGAVRDVLSLANAIDIRSVDDGLDISPFASGLEDGSTTLAEIRKRVLGNPVYAGNLVSVSGDATALVIYFNDISDFEYIRGGIHDQIMRIIEEERGSTDVYLTGTPYFKVAMSEALIRDLLWTPPLITIILVIVLVAAYRSVIGVIAPLLTVGAGVILTLGTISALGHSLSMISVLVPPLLMILGFSYAVHVTSEYHQLRKQAETGAPIVKQALQHMALPVTLTGLTTIAGFVAMMANPIGAVQEFGIFAAIGVVYVSVLSITFTPALLKVLDRRPRGSRNEDRPATRGFDRFVEYIALYDLKHRNVIFVIAAILFMLALAGIMRIHVSTES